MLRTPGGAHGGPVLRNADVDLGIAARSRMSGSSRVALVLRRLVVLLVAVGLVGMHQLTGGGHLSSMTGMMASASPGPAGAAVARTTSQFGQLPRAVGPRPALSHLQHVAADHAPLTPAADTPRSSPPAAALAFTHRTVGAVDLMGLMALCLAVLSALLMLWQPLRGRLRARRHYVTRGPVMRLLPSPPGRGPPRRLLAQICVLRT